MQPTHAGVLELLDKLHAHYDRVGELSGIRADLARVLTETVRRERANLCVEVGMANGLSTLAILAALIANGAGRLISIDPFQSTHWQNRGRVAVQQAGADSFHECREQYNFLALGDLVREHVIVDFAYVDGMHTFDHCLIDFFFLDQVLRVGGVIGFNDCNLKAVHHVIRHIIKNRAYREIAVGLRPEYSSNMLVNIKRRLEGRNGTDRYFRKVAHWNPAVQWNEFRYF